MKLTKNRIKSKGPFENELEWFQLNGYQFINEMYLFVNFWESKELPTAGVTADRFGLHLYWNPDFTETLNRPQLRYLMLHELFHLLFNHNERGKFFDHHKANIVMDEIINSEIEKQYFYVYSQKNNEIERPTNPILLVPKDYDGIWVFEVLYKWHQDRADKQNEENNFNDSENSNNSNNSENSENNQDGNSYDSDSDGQPMTQEELEKSVDKVFAGKSTDEDNENTKPIDTHLENDMTSEEKEENTIWKKVYSDQLFETMKSRGTEDSRFKSLLEMKERLEKSKKDYLKEIKKTIQQMKGSNKNKTFKRPNKKVTGLKGNEKLGYTFNVILDTSGSMICEFEKVLSVIFQNNITFNLIHADTKVEKVEFIDNKRKLQKINLAGLGGTTLQPAIDFIANNKKMAKLNTVILTDGWTDRLNTTVLKNKVLIVTTDTNCPLTNNSVNVKQVKVEK